MKIDFEYKDLKFIWDTDQAMVNVFIPAKPVDRFEVPQKMDYKLIKKYIQDYTDFCFKDKLVKSK